MIAATLRTLRTRAIACGWRVLALRTLVLAAAWWVLTNGEPTGLVFGALVVLAALIASLSVPPSPSPAAWQPTALIRFAFAFVVGSVRGGFDVARRAFARNVRIAPYTIEYTLRVPEGTARNLLLGTLSLMPGTMAIACQDQRLEVHLLASRAAFADELAALEALIANAAGQRLEEPRA